MSATPRTSTWTLPRVLVADDGEPGDGLGGFPMGIFQRDLDLVALISRATAVEVPWAVDADSIRGLHPDGAAAAFLVERLGARAVVSRRPAVVRAASAMGAIGLLAVHAFDSTGLRRIAASGPLPPGVGTLLSPGLVLPHLRTDELAMLPRPLVGHGLIVRPADALACLEQADAIVLRRDAARFLVMSLRGAAQRSGQALTTVPIEE